MRYVKVILPKCFDEAFRKYAREKQFTTINKFASRMINENYTLAEPYEEIWIKISDEAYEYLRKIGSVRVLGMQILEKVCEVILCSDSSKK